MLAPAGDLEKLKIAILYGASAVFIGGINFSLRSRASNFTLEDIKEGCDFAHKHNARVHATTNIVMHNSDLTGLEDYLVSEGAQPVVPGLLDFLLYCLFNNLEDTKLYGRNRWKYPFIRLAFKFFQRCQLDQINILKKDGRFLPGGAIKTTISYASGYIDLGTKMGEGWLLTTEMLELYHQGIKNIICTQPFGCLPNHICGKGMMKPIKEHNPDINIVAIDYDASSPAVNQQNRIKLMLANAQK